MNKPLEARVVAATVVARSVVVECPYCSDAHPHHKCEPGRWEQRMPPCARRRHLTSEQRTAGYVFQVPTTDRQCNTRRKITR